MACPQPVPCYHLSMHAGVFAIHVLPAIRRGFARLLAHPRVFGVVLLLLTLLAGAQAANLRVEADLSGLVSPRSQAVERMRDYQARFGRITSDEMLLVSAPSLADDDTLAAFEDLLIELQFVEGAEAVLSLHSIPAPGRATSWLASPEMAALPAGGRLDRMRAENPLAAQLLAPDLSATLIVVVPRRGAGGAELLAGIQDALRLADPVLTIENVGLSELHRAITRELIQDLRLLVPAAVVLCILLTALVFRSVRAVVVCALPPVIGVLWFFGWAGWAGVAVDPLTASLPVVLIVLCFSDCMHLFHAAIAARRAGGPQGAAVAQAMEETLPAMVLTTITTILAFATLTLPGAPSLTAMGQAGMVGMVLCLLAALSVAPILMMVLGTPLPGTRPPSGFSLLVAPAQRASRWVRPAPVVAGVLVLGLLALQSQSRIGFRYNEYLPEGAPVSTALARMEAAGLGSDRLFVVVQAAPLRATDEVPHANARAAARAVWGMPDTPAAWLDTAQDAGLFDRLAAADGQAHALPVQLPITAGSGPADAAIRALEARLEDAGLADVAHLVGPSHALLTEGPRLVESLRFGLYLTILSITILIGLAYRSWRMAALALVPNLIPILGVEAWLVLSGRDLTIMNVIALTVAFGIAVDDTLHMFNRFQLAKGADVHARVEAALAHAGPPITATTVILMGGLLVTGLSALPGVALYGFLIALAVLLALLADLFLLPALIRWGLK